MSTRKQVGTLVVVVLKARHLKDSHTFYKQDPYAVIQLGSVKHQTKVDVKGGQHPVWDDEFRIDIYNQPSASDRKLKVSVHSKEYREDELIGEAEVDINETLKKGEFDEWVTVELDRSFRGEVYLEMTYYSVEPPPITRRPSKLAPKDRLSRPPVTPPKERTSPYLSPQNASAVGTGHPLRSSQPTDSSAVLPSVRPPSATHSPLDLPPSLQVPKIHPQRQSPPSLPHVPKQTAIPGHYQAAHDTPLRSPPSFHFPGPELPPRATAGSTAPANPSPSPLPPPKFQDPTLKNIPFLDVGPPLKAEVTSPKPLQHIPSVLRPTHVKSSPIPVQSRVPPQLPPRQSEDPRELFRRQLEESDAEFAAKLAQSEGLDLERLRMEEEDAELARRLAAEEGGDETHIPGGWQ